MTLWEGGVGPQKHLTGNGELKPSREEEKEETVEEEVVGHWTGVFEGYRIGEGLQNGNGEGETRNVKLQR